MIHCRAGIWALHEQRHHLCLHFQSIAIIVLLYNIFTLGIDIITYTCSWYCQRDIRTPGPNSIESLNTLKVISTSEKGVGMMVVSVILRSSTTLPLANTTMSSLEQCMRNIISAYTLFLSVIYAGLQMNAPNTTNYREISD